MKKTLKPLKALWSWGNDAASSFMRANCSMHAAALTYFSMLAFVPILCVLLVAAKSFGVAEYAERQINVHIDAMIANVERAQDDSLAKLAAGSEEEREKKRIAAKEFADQARSISTELFDRIEKFDIGTLGWIGFGFLVWTVISSVGMVEVSFNQIFDVASPRPVWLRMALYLGLTVVLPVTVAVIFSLPVFNAVKGVFSPGVSSAVKPLFDTMARLVDSPVVRGLFVTASSAVVFSFLYWILPNRRIRPRHAVYGGLITSVCFGGWLKACAVAQVGISKSSALYGSFAFLPIILAWFYISWQLILLGACMTRAFERDRREERR